MKKKINLNLGCGVHLLKGFINIDNTFSLKDLKSKKGIFSMAKIEPGAKFLNADMRKLPFKDNSVDYIECLEAIEHVPFKGVEIAIKEMHRVLKPGSKAVIFTQDFDDMAKMWVEHVADQPWSQHNWFLMDNVIYGNQMTEGEFHRSAFNATYFNGLMQACGFKDFVITLFPRGTFPPRFKGAKWPKKTMATGMILVEATK